jgi:hypothetical protein
VEDANDGLPRFPSSPEGVTRIEHLPTVEACIRYWQAIRILAAGAGMFALARTASGLQASYEQAHKELKRAAETNAAPYARRGRLRFGRSRNDTIDGI